MNINFEARAVTLMLECNGLVGGKTLTLSDESGGLKLTFPAGLWPFLQPGDMTLVTISPVKAVLTNATPVLPGLA